MSLFDIYKAKQLGASAGSLFDAKAGGKLNKDAWKKGFNKWNEEWELGSIDDTTGENAPSNSSIRSKEYIPITANTTYFFNIGNLGDYWFRLVWYDADKNYISGKSPYEYQRKQTSPVNAAFVRFATNGLYGNTYKNDICINISGEHNGEYVPYNG